MDGSPVRNRHTSLSADEAYDSFAGIRPFRRARPLWARASRILRGVLVDWQPRVVFGLLLADVLAWMLFAAYTADNATVGESRGAAG